MKACNNMITLATLLANGLLSFPKGIALVKVIRQIQTFLPVYGKDGAGILQKKLNEGIFAALRDTVLSWNECRDAHNLRYVLQRYSLIRVGWIKDAYTVVAPTISGSLAIKENVELMAQAENDEELERLLQKVSHHVLREDGVLVEDCVYTTEYWLTQWIVKVINDHADALDLSVSAQRDLDLHYLLENGPVGNNLALIAGFRGRFVPVSSLGVNLLPVQDRADFLEIELSRLTDILPIRDFDALLFQLANASPVEDPLLTEWQQDLRYWRASVVTHP